uniref:Protein argonaute n=1 Tax=Thermosporothrix sp. COM3 TaxID=2490863 RepID=A0A455SIA3_9CHLR|nr:hypothetical protein KTC_14100 [Thermosporothrix sp. COM3]
MQMKPVVISELFPVQPQAIPELLAYELQTADEELAAIGGKLPYRLKKAFSGRWAWSTPYIVTDTPVEDIQAFVETLRNDPSEAFASLLALQPVPDWQPTPQAQADFAARALWPELRDDVDAALARFAHNLNRTLVTRECEVRGWTIWGQPALSISIRSRLQTIYDLQSYLKNVDSVDAILHFMVADRASTMQGTVMDIVGPVAEHRERLLAFKPKERSKRFIEQAADDEIVVRIYAHRRTYDYVARALRILARPADYERLGIDPEQAEAALRLTPAGSSTMLEEVVRIGRKRGLLGPAYSSQRHSASFLDTADLHFTPTVRVGQNHTCEVSALQEHIQQYGVYKHASLKKPVAIGVLNALPDSPYREFLEKLHQTLRLYRVPARYNGVASLQTFSHQSLEEALHYLHERGADLILALLPDEPGREAEQWGLADLFTALTIALGISGQIVHQATLTHGENAIALSILNKLGGTPHALGTPLPYADMVVGFDVACPTSKQPDDEIPMTAISRIFRNTGEFLRYELCSIKGEKNISEAIQALFPATLFQGKRVVIHRDGPFRGNEKQALQAWGAHIQAQFLPVEILRTGIPHLYGVELSADELSADRQAQAIHPSAGCALKLDEQQALLVTAQPSAQEAPVEPLHIRTEPPLSIEQALHSVLSFTLLHADVQTRSRFPVTIHYSDIFASLLLRGIKPVQKQEAFPF